MVESTMVPSPFLHKSTHEDSFSNSFIHNIKCDWILEAPLIDDRLMAHNTIWQILNEWWRHLIGTYRKLWDIICFLDKYGSGKSRLGNDGTFVGCVLNTYLTITGYEWKRWVIIWTLMGHNMGNYVKIIRWEIIGYGKSLGNCGESCDNYSGK